jgi:hypothetical protein
VKAEKNLKRAGLAGLAALTVLSFAAPRSASASIRQGTIEFLTGRCSISEPRFKTIYEDTGSIQGVSLSGSVFFNLNLYLDVKTLTRTGTLSFSKEKTTFRMVPISAGLRYILPLPIAHPYLGAGADWYFYNEDNPIETVLDATTGYHLLAGVYVHPFENVPLAVNLRIKFTKADAVMEGVPVSLGGTEYGVGFAIVF